MDKAKIEAALERMVREVVANPGTFGVPESLEDGGPLDSDSVATWIAARLRAGGAHVRLVVVRLVESGRFESLVEVWHPLAKSWLRVDPLLTLPAKHERVAELEVP